MSKLASAAANDGELPTATPCPNRVRNCDFLVQSDFLASRHGDERLVLLKAFNPPLLEGTLLPGVPWDACLFKRNYTLKQYLEIQISQRRCISPEAFLYIYVYMCLEFQTFFLFDGYRNQIPFLPS